MITFPMLITAREYWANLETDFIVPMTMEYKGAPPAATFATNFWNLYSCHLVSFQ